MLGQVKVHLECILHLEQTWWHHVGMATECTYSLAKTIVLEQAFPLQSWVRVLLRGQRSRVIQLHSYRGNMILQSTLGFATMGKAANLCLATRNAVTDLF